MNLRRYPHLRRTGEPDMLELLGTLPPGDARELERLVKHQDDGDRRFHERAVLSGDPGVLDARAAMRFTTGGGRRRPALAGCE